MKISTIIAAASFVVIAGISWYAVKTSGDGNHNIADLAVTVTQEHHQVRPQARPSDLVEIGNHWIWAHELVDCQLGAGPICTDDQPRGLSDTDLAVLNALGGEDI